MSTNHQNSRNQPERNRTGDTGDAEFPESSNLLFHPGYLDGLDGNLGESLPKLYAAKWMARESIREMLDLVDHNPESLKSGKAAAIADALEQTQAVLDAIDSRPLSITDEEIAVLGKTMDLLQQVTREEARLRTSP